MFIVLQNVDFLHSLVTKCGNISGKNPFGSHSCAKIANAKCPFHLFKKIIEHLLHIEIKTQNAVLFFCSFTQILDQRTTLEMTAPASRYRSSEYKVQ